MNSQKWVRGEALLDVLRKQWGDSRERFGVQSSAQRRESEAQVKVSRVPEDRMDGGKARREVCRKNLSAQSRGNQARFTHSSGFGGVAVVSSCAMC